MNQAVIHLGELIEPAKTQKAGDGDYPLLSMTMKGGLVDPKTKFKKRIASENTSGYKVVSNGQLVVGFPIDEGVLSFQVHHPEAIVSPAYGIWNVRNGKAVHRPYLERFLKSPQAISYYLSKLRSTTARRRSLDRESFEALPVPLPPLDEQRRIAAILDKADHLRRLRQKSLNRLNQLSQSIFYQMFGDLENDGKLEDYIDIRSSLVSPTDSKFQNCLHVGPEHLDKNGGAIKWDKVQTAVEDAVKSGKYLFGENEIIYSKIRPYLNKVAISDRSGICSADMYVLLPKDKIATVEFIKFLLMSQRFLSYAEGVSGRANIPKINRKGLCNFDIRFPTFRQQQIFSEKIQTIGKFANTIGNSNRFSSQLFASLQQRAFRGGL